MKDTRRELLRVMLELAKEDREAYRELRAAAWAMIARRHGKKTPAQLAAWLEGAS